MNRVGLQQVTMNTGTTRVSFPDEDDFASRERMAPLVVDGQHRVHWVEGTPPVWVWVTSGDSAAMATIVRAVSASDPRPAPLALMGVAADEAAADELWGLLTDPRHAGHAGAGTPERPSALPWLGTWRLPGLQAHPRDVDWLPGFQRCWAWAWLSARQR